MEINEVINKSAYVFTIVGMISWFAIVIGLIYEFIKYIIKKFKK
jgi:hypothetical protein